MSKQKRALIAAAICLVAVAWFLETSGRASQQSQDKRTRDEMALRAALSRGGLREAAKLKELARKWPDPGKCCD